MNEIISRDSEASIRRRKIISILSLILIIIVFSLIAYYVGRPLIHTYTDSPEVFRAQIEEKGFFGQLLMVGIMMMQVIVALIPGEPLEVAAGFVFGWLEGAMLCLIGSALAGALIMLAVKKWGVKLVEAFFPPEKINRFSFLRVEKKRNIIMFLLFLIPGTPKDILNYLAGLTPMKISTFVLLTTLARIPSVVSSTVTGSLAQEGNLTAAIITYAVTGVISLACILWYRHISKLEKKENTQRTENA